MENLFEEYKKLRISRNITLDEISEKTRINKEYLEKIERGDLEFLPYPYVKGFIKVYAKYIGVDLQELEENFDELARIEKKVQEAYETQKEVDKKEGKKTEKDLTGASEHLKKLKGKGKIIVFSSAAVLIIMLFFIIGSVVTGSHEREIKSLSKETYESIQIPEPPPVKPAEKESFTVEIHAKEETWLRIKKDDGEDTEYLLKSGEKITVTASDNISMRTGKSQGIEIFLNGKNLGVLGPENTLLWELIITKDGIQKRQLKMRTDIDSTNIG